METLDNNNWNATAKHVWWQGKTNPVWQGYYLDLPYVNEPFNDPASLAEWRALGYTQTKFTGDMYDMRNPEPEWIEAIRKVLPWKHFSWSVYRMEPGCCLPTHGDTYARFCKLYNITDFNTIHRAIFFMEDWQSGHVFEIDGLPQYHWCAGDYYVWQYNTPHLAANVGKTNRYSLQITGVIE
jgi:hypothetical protein